MNVLKGIDLVYDSYNNEFVLGKKRIMVTAEATNFDDGKPVFDSKDLVFYSLPTGAQDEQIIKEIDMTLRCQDHETALQNRLNLLSAKCGFGENYYKFDKGNIQTATQVISENSTLFRTVKKHEIILETAMKNLIQSILTIGKEVLKIPLNPNVEMAIDFDDSIIEDTATERQRDLQDVRDGIMPKWEYRAKWYAEDEKTAKAMIQETQSNDDVMGFGGE